MVKVQLQELLVLQDQMVLVEWEVKAVYQLLQEQAVQLVQMVQQELPVYLQLQEQVDLQAQPVLQALMVKVV